MDLGAFLNPGIKILRIVNVPLIAEVVEILLSLRIMAALVPRSLELCVEVLWRLCMEA